MVRFGSTRHGACCTVRPRGWVAARRAQVPRSGGLTSRSSRCRFAARLNSGVTPLVKQRGSVMIRWQLALLLLAAGLISIWLMVKVVTSDRSRLDKFGAILLLAVPFVGPLLYWFVYNDLPPQHPRL